ncbi:MAG: phosphoribosyltransferase [Candidatus Thermoplasmatota archaeon]|nr:phosphoribosyltransferase [Euryarchaeota archaeon]MBU4031647.1 phosphoribosyltransferase [Candidatus Thermoplasmatota archaeon]MBU4070723.1 phosphoribosyltransferase [Candidatus Thermoplasmatota archaeon]MBU4143348.1 phosphoribosyltransferase [Candidatus Thermoplasmatota archaeon]MBU4591175.1 phosphoribosyltransferase [Candidatus Thermoplasmatota archaeon]
MSREKSSKTKEQLGILDKLYQYFKAGLWRQTRQLFDKYDDSEDAITGVDITNYLAPSALKLRSMHSIVQLMSKVRQDVGKNAIFIGVERKGYVFAGALLDEFEETDIILKGSRHVNEKDVKGKTVVLIDDASKTGKTIIDKTKEYQKLGADVVIAIVALATKAAVDNINIQFKSKNVALFSHTVCENEDEYAELYPLFYHIVSSSSIPIAGEPKAEIHFATNSLDLVVKTLCNLDRGKYVNIDSIENSYPVRGTIDYYEYTLANGAEEFKEIGDKTGFFITLEQSKIRLYFDFDGTVIVKLCPIVYLEIPEKVNCREYEKCKKSMDLVGQPLLCVKCIEEMIGDILLGIMKEDLDRKASALHLKYRFKKL